MPSLERIFDVNTLSSEQLGVLKLSREDLAHKTQAEVIAMINEQYKLLVRTHHPDKNRDDIHATQKFQVIAEARAALLGVLEIHKPEFYDYIERRTIDLHPTIFNVVMEEEIEGIYAELRREFLEQKTEDSKKGFAQQYVDFFNLAETLEANKELTKKTRAEELQRQEFNITLPELWFQGWRKLWLQDWRKLMLTLFGEEYLNDFQYREALATGDLWPVLSNTKLMQPIKWITILLYSVLLFIVLVKQALLEIGHKILPEWGIIIATILMIGASIFVPPPVFMLIMGASIYQKALLALACPYNFIFRPLEGYFAQYSTALSSSFAALTLLALCVTGVAAVAMLPAETLLLSACIATSLWGVYQYNALKNAFDTSCNNLGWIGSIVFGFLMTLHVLAASLCSIDLFISMQCFIFHLPQPPIFLLWSDVSSGCMNNLMIYEGTQQLENQNKIEGEVTEQLPLPKEQVSDEIKAACLLVSPRATQSHYFFNTPKDALPKGVEPRQPFVRAPLQLENTDATQEALSMS